MSADWSQRNNNLQIGFTVLLPGQIPEMFATPSACVVRDALELKIEEIWSFSRGHGNNHIDHRN